jgi:RNA polymerase-binding transcription factor DksA
MNEERWRRLLLEERRRVEDALERYRGELAATSEELASADQHQADAATGLHEREDAEGRIAQLEERLAAVAQAEQLLKSGRYGTSVESGEPIREARLNRPEL